MSRSKAFARKRPWRVVLGGRVVRTFATEMNARKFADQWYLRKAKIEKGES